MNVCGILNKQIDFEDIHDYALAHEEYFNKKLELWSGIPCAATFRNVFRLIKPENFLKVFIRLKVFLLNKLRRNHFYIGICIYSWVLFKVNAICSVYFDN